MRLIKHLPRLRALWLFIQYKKSSQYKTQRRAALIKYFQKEKGLLLKLGQIWGTSQELKELLWQTDFQKESPNFVQLKQKISKDLGQDFDQVFDSLNLLSDKASLSTVYQARLKASNEQVVLKVKLPWIEKRIDDQIDFLKWIFQFEKFSPFKKHRFSIEAYLLELEQMVTQELDYPKEVEAQKKYFLINSDNPQVVIPKTYPEYVFKDWFVQEKIEGDDFFDMLKQWEMPERESLAYLMVNVFLKQLLVYGHVQGDSHFGNYLFQRGTDYYERIVFLDFGSHLWPSQLERKALMTLFDGAHQSNLSEDKVLNALVILGFDEEKVASLGPILLTATQQLLSVLSTDCAVYLHDQRQPRLEDLLEEKKWILRSSGPPRFLNIMRAFYGVIEMMKKSQIRLNYYQIYRRFRQEHQDLLTEVKLPQLSVTRMDRTTQAKNLKIVIKRNGQTSVDLSMPVGSIYELEELLPANAAKQLEEQKIDLEKIKQQAIQNGLKPAVLFEWEKDDKSYCVSLV